MRAKFQTLALMYSSRLARRLLMINHATTLPDVVTQCSILGWADQRKLAAGAASITGGGGGPETRYPRHARSPRCRQLNRSTPSAELPLGSVRASQAATPAQPNTAAATQSPASEVDDSPAPARRPTQDRPAQPRELVSDWTWQSDPDDQSPGHRMPKATQRPRRTNSLGPSPGLAF